MPGLIARALLETPEGRRRYLDRRVQLTEKLFDVSALTNRVQQIAATPRRAMASLDPKSALEHEQGVE